MTTTTPRILAAATLAILFAGSARAGEIQNRKSNQQQRIAQGVKSGQLTAGETAKLESKEAGINREERAMRRADGGKLTAGDRKVINQQQNQVSRQIYREKHDGEKRP